MTNTNINTIAKADIIVKDKDDGTKTVLELAKDIEALSLAIKALDDGSLIINPVKNASILGKVMLYSTAIFHKSLQIQSKTR